MCDIQKNAAGAKAAAALVKKGFSLCWGYWYLFSDGSEL
jgi:hypothetical protein